MLEGWFKFHRKTGLNYIWRHDPTAWRVFEALLMLCNLDDGTWEGGRFQLAEFCGLNSNTTYKAIKRLEKSKMLTLVSNNKFTLISIENWSKYQSGVNTSGEQQSNNKVTTKEQQSNTLIRNKNKEIRNNNRDFLTELIQIVNPREKPTAERSRVLAARQKDYTDDEIREAAKRFADSDWHKRNGQLSIDNLIAPSKFGRWYVAEKKEQSGYMDLSNLS